MYRIFWSTWWKENPSWPEGLEPYGGKRHYLDDVACETAEEARAMCRELNDEPLSAKEKRLGKKYEYTSI